MMGPHRKRPAYLAFLGHRLSGLGLAIFLPLHFLVLGLALEGQASLDGMLALSDLPYVKAAEWGLVVLLALHLSFGLRLLLLEFHPWRSRTADRRSWIIGGAVLALALGGVFLWGVV